MQVGLLSTDWLTTVIRYSEVEMSLSACKGGGGYDMATCNVFICPYVCLVLYLHFFIVFKGGKSRLSQQLKNPADKSKNVFSLLCMHNNSGINLTPAVLSWIIVGNVLSWMICSRVYVICTTTVLEAQWSPSVVVHALQVGFHGVVQCATAYACMYVYVIACMYMWSHVSIIMWSYLRKLTTLLKSNLFSTVLARLYAPPFCIVVRRKRRGGGV